MKRRVFLSTAATSTAVIAGCTGSDEPEDTPEDTNTEPDTPTNTSTDTSTDTGTPTETTSEYDAVIEYTTHVQNRTSGEYELPELNYEDWSWIVMDFEVVEGELDMEDVWFNGLFETEERYYTVSKQTDKVKNGIEARGAIRQGSSGVTLHEYPPSPSSGLVGPVFSATDTSIQGEGVRTDELTELYPAVTVEYAVETVQDPDVLPNEHDADQGNMWAVVSLDVVEGVLNLEDVWFRSQLLTGSRVYECDHASKVAERGVRARGLVKEGYSANALYQIAEDESVEEWGYQEDNRQDVTIQRV